MELYYKDLISKGASLEELVDESMLAVQGTDEMGWGVDSVLDSRRKHEILRRLRRIKHSCRVMRNQAEAAARATGKMLRQSPYSAVGLAFAFGLLAGLVLRRRQTGTVRRK